MRLSHLILLMLLVLTSASCRDVEKEQVQLNRKRLRAVFHARVRYIDSLRRLFPETNYNGYGYFKYDSAMENFVCYDTEDVVAYGSFDSTGLHIGESATYKGPNAAYAVNDADFVGLSQEQLHRHPEGITTQREYLDYYYDIIKRKFLNIVYHRVQNEGEPHNYIINSQFYDEMRLQPYQMDSILKRWDKRRLDKIEEWAELHAK